MLHVSILSKEWQVVNCERFHEKKKRQRAFSLRCVLFPGLIMNVICASCVEHLRWLYKTCLFLLGVKTVWWKDMLGTVPSAPRIWIWPSALLLCFPDIFYGMCQAMVFKLVCPEKKFWESWSFDIYYVLASVCLHVHLFVCLFSELSLPWIIVCYIHV